MHGYGAHTFKWVNANNEVFYVKYTFKTDQGIKNFTDDEQKKIQGIQPFYSTRDLHDSIEKGDFPSWTMYVQIMPESESYNYKWDIFDVTKVWPHSDYPLLPVGKLVLN
jgi:catalase